MEKNINLAKILNGKPVNTKLWSPLFGDVYTSSICSEDTIIVVNHHAESSSFYNNGKYFDHAEAEPLLFPSKEMRDWSKFTWKKGDVLISNDGKKEVFFNGFTDGTYALFKAKHGFEILSDGNTMYLADEDGIATSDYTLEDKDAAQTYINAIEERFGGKLNRETLKVEKPQPEFKDGDIVVYGESVAICRKIYKHTLYFYVSIDETFGLLFDDNRVSAEGYRFATDEEKHQLFDALANKGKAWDAEKKQIVDSKPKVELKPFDKVLVRNDKEDQWSANIFSYQVRDNMYYCLGECYWIYCIPYEGNEHLLGTTDNFE
jgi:hypothetical protein